jgi:hypothetical protein
VQGEDVAGQALVELGAVEIAREAQRAVGERGPVAQVAVGEQIVDQANQVGVGVDVERVVGA